MAARYYIWLFWLQRATTTPAKISQIRIFKIISILTKLIDYAVANNTTLETKIVTAIVILTNNSPRLSTSFVPI